MPNTTSAATVWWPMLPPAGGSWFLHTILTTLSWHDKSWPFIRTTLSGQICLIRIIYCW